MTVKELIAGLTKVENQDATIILSIDDEYITVKKFEEASVTDSDGQYYESEEEDIDDDNYEDAFVITGEV